MTTNGLPFRLKPTFAERIWGRTSLLPWYAETGSVNPVGEAWLTGHASVIDTGNLAGKTLGEVASGNPELFGGSEFPLLVKMLFPSDKLSVQVHPNDEEAQALGLQRGKTECWYVLEAEPGATVACGLKAGVSTKDVAEAIRNGTLETLLVHLPVAVGDMVFVDAGTVHAIGPGVTLLEVQQTCDVTYRLYDYGRPRELHLEAGLAVVKTGTAAGLVAPQRFEDFTRLIETKYFVADRYDLQAGSQVEIKNRQAGCVVGLSGTGRIQGVEVKAGEALVLGRGPSLVEAADLLSFVWCWEPAPTGTEGSK